MCSSKASLLQQKHFPKNIHKILIEHKLLLHSKKKLSLRETCIGKLKIYEKMLKHNKKESDPIVCHTNLIIHPLNQWLVYWNHLVFHHSYRSSQWMDFIDETYVVSDINFLLEWECA